MLDFGPLLKEQFLPQAVGLQTYHVLIASLIHCVKALLRGAHCNAAHDGIKAVTGQTIQGDGLLTTKPGQ